MSAFQRGLSFNFPETLWGTLFQKGFHSCYSNGIMFRNKTVRVVPNVCKYTYNIFLENLLAYHKVPRLATIFCHRKCRNIFRPEKSN